MAGWISTGTVQQVIGLGWLKYAGVRSTCLVTRNFACTFSITLHCNLYTGTNSSESWWAIANKIPRSILFCRRTGDKKKSLPLSCLPLPSKLLALNRNFNKLSKTCFVQFSFVFILSKNGIVLHCVYAFRPSIEKERLTRNTAQTD